MKLGGLDPAVGEGMQGLPHSIGHLGQLGSNGGMGPVHGLDMEGGMPGRAMQPSSSAPGGGMVVGGPRGGEGLGNGPQGGGVPGGGVSDVGGREGSGALAQDFAALDMGGGALGSGSAGRGGEVQGFDASRDELLGDFPCVRLRGLAADTTVKDILDFFVGLGPVLDIVLESGAKEDEVGAITLFGNLMDYHGALQRYSLQIKGRYIEVAPAVRPDYYSAVIKRSGEGAAGGAAGGAAAGGAAAGAAGAGGGGGREGNGGPDATPSGAGIVSQPHGQAPGPAAAMRSAPQ
ncbi:unnamed protein product, partial [Laminaria digitata]